MPKDMDGKNWEEAETDRLYNAIKHGLKHGKFVTTAATGASMTKKNWQEITKISRINRKSDKLRKKWDNIKNSRGKREETKLHIKFNKLFKFIKYCKAQQSVSNCMYCVLTFGA